MYKMFKFFTSKSKGQRRKPLRAHKLLHAESKGESKTTERAMDETIESV